MKDNDKIINCPACGAPMKKVFLQNQQFMVDVCLDGCGGIWLDNRELNKVDEKSEDITELQDVYKGKQFKKVDSSQDRICPLCGTKMVKNSVSAKQEITIDECYSCGGKFFDYLELDKMRNQYENDEERLSDVKKIAKNSQAMEAIMDKLLQNEFFG